MTPEEHGSDHQVHCLYEWLAGEYHLIFLVLAAGRGAAFLSSDRPNIGSELRILVYDCHSHFRVQPGQTTWWPLRVPKHGDTFKLTLGVETDTLKGT